MLTPKQIKTIRNNGNDWLNMFTWDIYLRAKMPAIQRREAEKVFNQVAAHDPETARIIKTRYEKEWSWEKVAMMFYMSRRTVIRRVYNFFDEAIRILKEEKK